MSLTPAGLQLLKTLEGCSLVAYPDPPGSGSWSIGYGHNSPAVGQGQRISQQQADAWLLQDVAQAAAAVDQLLAGVALSPQQRDALISFCFNVGAGALGGSTLRRRLRAGEPVALVLKEELPRWCHGPQGPLDGLRRRRAAEVKHASGSATP